MHRGLGVGPLVVHMHIYVRDAQKQLPFWHYSNRRYPLDRSGPIPLAPTNQLAHLRCARRSTVSWVEQRHEAANSR
mgnify:FL=1